MKTTQTALPVKQPNSEIQDAKAVLVQEANVKLVQLQNEMDGVKELREAAITAQNKQSEAVRSYFDLCEVIRVKQLNSKVVTAELLALGYAKTTTSAVIRVAHTTDEIYQAYKERAIGFKLALTKARELDKPKQQKLELSAPDEKFALEIQAVFDAFFPASGPLPSFIKVERKLGGTDFHVTVRLKVRGNPMVCHIALEQLENEKALKSKEKKAKSKI